jgi:hypothetical protein
MVNPIGERLAAGDEEHAGQCSAGGPESYEKLPDE